MPWGKSPFAAWADRRGRRRINMHRNSSHDRRRVNNLATVIDYYAGFTIAEIARRDGSSTRDVEQDLAQAGVRVRPAV